MKVRRAPTRREDEPVSNPFEAKECVREGDALPLGEYLRCDVVPILGLIANGLEAGQLREEGDIGTDDQPSATQSGPVGDEEDEWISDTAATTAAVQDGSAEAAAAFLRDFAGLVRHIAHALAPTSKGSLTLRFVRPKGRPTNPEKMFRDSAIDQEIRFGALRHKKESLIEYSKNKRGLSRATVQRARTGKKPPKRRK